MDLVIRFGNLSGLRVQPDKSQILCLDPAITQSHYAGIRVVGSNETTRYLGYHVGTGEITNANWALRLRNVRRPLLTATGVATSVTNRVIVLNTIVLPSVLFTAAAFEIPHGRTGTSRFCTSISYETIPPVRNPVVTRQTRVFCMHHDKQEVSDQSLFRGQ